MSDFESFYRDHVRLVYSLALARTTNAWEAEDMTQDAFLRAWQHFEVLSAAEPAARRAWLVRTLRNLAVDAWRRRGLASFEPLADDFPGGEVDEQSAMRVDLARALASLEEEDREIVTLRYLEEMNSREIGEIMNLPEGTVRRRLAECREALGRQLPQWAPQGEAR